MWLLLDQISQNLVLPKHVSGRRGEKFKYYDDSVDSGGGSGDSPGL